MTPSCVHAHKIIFVGHDKMATTDGTEVPRGNTNTLGKKYRAYTCTAFCETYPIVECRYQVWGYEKCPTTGRDHWQGYVYFTNPRMFSSVRKLLAPHHVEIARGSVQQNEEYCKKDGVHVEFGVKPQQGERRDLVALKDYIMGGGTVEEILLDDPMAYHQYGRTLLALEDTYGNRQVRLEMTRGIWIHGPTGVGKSHTAEVLAGDDTIYHWSPDNGWWDGYTGQNVVIMNDFRGQIPYNEMLMMVDKWPFAVRRRNRKPRPFTAHTVIITSSLDPAGVYHNLAENDDLAQIYRRFDVRLQTSRDIST